MPFQRDQMSRVIEVLGSVDRSSRSPSRILYRKLTLDTVRANSERVAERDSIAGIPPAREARQVSRQIFLLLARHRLNRTLLTYQVSEHARTMVQFSAASRSATYARFRLDATTVDLRSDQEDDGSREPLSRLVGPRSETSRQVSLACPRTLIVRAGTHLELDVTAARSCIYPKASRIRTGGSRTTTRIQRCSTRPSESTEEVRTTPPRAAQRPESSAGSIEPVPCIASVRKIYLSLYYQLSLRVLLLLNIAREACLSV